MRLTTRRPHSDSDDARPTIGGLSERALIHRLTRLTRRPEWQLNERHESDAELLRVPGGVGSLLALSTDAVVEEVESGLYDDPVQIGWTAVAAVASDLAAVGAEPLGILLDVTLPRGAPVSDLERLADGVRRSCSEHGLPLLGGDTSIGAGLRVAGTGVGWVPDGVRLTRRGARPGDGLFATGPAGLGGAWALSRLREAAIGSRAVPVPDFLPRARLAEGRICRGVASSCVDTSDGLLAGLDELGRQNAVGFVLEVGVESTLHPSARDAAAAAGLPAWLMLAGPHGDFELLFTVRPADRERLEALSRRTGWTPVHLGRVVRGAGLRLETGDGPDVIDPGRVRALHPMAAEDPDRYLAALRRIDSGGGPWPAANPRKDGAA